MKVFMFVNMDFSLPNYYFKSPGHRSSKLDYSAPYPKVIDEKDFDPGSLASPYGGIYVIPYDENPDFTEIGIDIVYKMIFGEVEEEDIISYKESGVMRVKKFTVMGEITDKDKMRPRALIRPRDAFDYAFYIDRCPRDDTRKAVLSDPRLASDYVGYIDRCPRDDTRKAVLSDPECTYTYAFHTDKCPRDDTRNAILCNPRLAFHYAAYIDKCPREDTRNAALNDPLWAAYYKEFEAKFHKNQKTV